MFGLKIRSWMENHIVRPRKKGNKNKNGNSGNLVTSINNTQNGHKAISSNQGDSSVVGSPARRSEVSPIQNHTTSRFGWHSPQDEEFCRNIDPNYPYMLKSSTVSPRNMYRQRNSTINNRSSTSSNDKTTNSSNSTQQLQSSNSTNSNSTYSKTVDAKHSSRAFDVHTNPIGNHTNMSSCRDNSAILRTVAATYSTYASESRQQHQQHKYPYHSYESNEMLGEQQQQLQQRMFNGKYEKNHNATELNDCAHQMNGIILTNGMVGSSGGGTGTSSADDGDYNQAAMKITTMANGENICNNFNGTEINGGGVGGMMASKKSSKPDSRYSINHQSATTTTAAAAATTTHSMQNYHNNHQSNQQQSHHHYQYELQHHHFSAADRQQQKYESFQSGSDLSSSNSTSSNAKSDQQTVTIYQQNGFLMKQKKQQQQLVNNNNEKPNRHCDSDNNNSNNIKNNSHARDEMNGGDGYAVVPNDDIIIVGKSLKENRYGKILNSSSGNSSATEAITKSSENNCINNAATAISSTTKATPTTKDHRIGAPIPMLPSPPSTPPPPLIESINNNMRKCKQSAYANGVTMESFGKHQAHHQHNRFNAKANKFPMTTSSTATHNNAKYVDSCGSSNINNNNEIILSNNNNNNNGIGFESYADTVDGSGAGDAYNQYHHQQLSVNGHQKHGNETTNHLMRSASHPSNQQQQQKTRYANNSHLTPAPGNHPLAHVINHLSSPESAYSTGYSTDGTSPGTTNAPEYYINMRTGTHYFPRGVNAVAAVERSRQKFGLNKIEETVGESILSSTTTTATAIVSHHRRTESCDLSQKRHQTTVLNGAALITKEMCNLMQTNTAHSRMSPDLQRSMAYQNYRGFESPSPRQRCRIRTNPWLSTPDATAAVPNGNAMMKKMDIDTSSTSSGVKSSSDAGTDDKQCKNHISSESESSSSTEIEVSRKSFSPNTIRKRKMEKQQSERLSNRVSTGTGNCDSEDEDATFNELMGKFDESYIYEKETDILSDDSDPTECVSDLDTGQDGGDECDTDELLDIDYIDTGSIQEVVDKDVYKNTGSCTYYHSNQSIDKRQTKLRKSRKQQSEDNGGSRRRKRLTRTRKRNSEHRDGSQTSHKTNSPCRFRESRSVGGTPVSLRRNKSGNKHESRFLAIAESEKALLKADIEADVKYKQLIHEAETILVSMKTTALRETPVPSPSRRICNVPANKRVEMLRNCEADLRRELSKTQSKNDGEMICNKKEPYEVNAAPLSPVKISYANGNGGRFSPRKTHLTNFISQNIAPVEMLRRQNVPDSQTGAHQQIEVYETKMKRSPCLNFNDSRAKITPPKSPTPRRRFRSQSPRVCIEESDSDSDTLNANGPVRKPTPKRAEINGNKENKTRQMWRKSRQSVAKEDIINQNTISAPCNEVEGAEAADNRPFRSMDMTNPYAESFYCPQSEPLKRKIYSEKTLDRLQKSFDMESEIPKKALLQKISNLRKDRQQQAAAAHRSQSYTKCEVITATNGSDADIASIQKRQLILSTIEDLKRNLEDQSVELSGLNDDE